MKTIVINESELRNIITEAVHKVFEEHNDFNSVTNIPHGDILKIGEIIWITNREDFNMYAEQIWDMLTVSYYDLGGLKSYRNFKDFVNKKPCAKIVMKNNELFACATYRRLDDIFKMIAIGCDQSQEGKMALQQIIQDDILNYKMGYWVEVSGAIEHYFKKFNGFPIPNIMVGHILGNMSNGVVLSNKDEVHYERPIGADGEMFTKMIFGFKSESDYNEMLKHINDYTQFMQKVYNQVFKSVFQEETI